MVRPSSLVVSSVAIAVLLVNTRLSERALNPSSAFFRCKPTGELLPRSAVCNGTAECPDESDEQHCTVKCKAGQAVCDNRETCLNESLFCDGNEDCPDNSDEAHCKNKACPRESFECWKSAACIPLDKICDHHKDCEDGEDEDMCLDMNSEQKARATVVRHQQPPKCPPNKFQCANGKCISASKLCNGRKDCKDGSDEEYCAKTTPPSPKGACRQNQFRCTEKADGIQYCIPLPWVCDGKADCPDGLDELHCHMRTPCRLDHFSCRNDACIDRRLVCNNIDDCGDNSDEERCSDAASAPRTCAAHEYRCDMGPCLPMKSICDGIAECPHGDDEKFCKKTSRCLAGQFQCAGVNLCLPDKWVCDGVNDCPDESDERHCPERAALRREACGQDGFICGNGDCIERAEMCDGHEDCTDGSDEHQWCGACKRNNGGCPHKCRETAHGVECLCKNEWRLASFLVEGEQCQDEAICEQGTHSCRHYCHPVQGDYRCSCADGYVLEQNGETCKLEDQQVGRILFSTGDQLRSISLNDKETGTDYSVLMDAADSRLLALDHVSATGKSYYSRESTVYYFNGKEHCLFGNFAGFANVAVDWVTGNIYYVDEKTTAVGMCSADGRFCRTFDSVALGLPRGIALHPKFGYLFVTDWSNDPCIMRIAMDGSSWTILHKEKLTWPNAVSIDYVRDRLYWVDAKHHLIESSRLDGTDRRVLTGGGVLHPFDLAVFDDHVFWSDWNLKAIMTTDIYNTSMQRPVRSFESQPYGIAVDHPVFQNSTLPNPCLKSTCSHLCALSPNDRSMGHPKAKCLCPNGYATYSDGERCLPIISGLSPTIGWCLKTFNDRCVMNTACQNGGTCRYEYDSQERLRQIFCECPKHYKGLYCEVVSREAGARRNWSLLIVFIMFTALVLVGFLLWKYRSLRDDLHRGLRKLKSSQSVLRTFSRHRQPPECSDRVHLIGPCEGLANPIYREKQCFIRSNPLNSYDSAASTSHCSA